MYLNRVDLSASAFVKEKLFDPYSIKTGLFKAFPGAERSFLYRLRTPEKGFVNLLVLSQSKPVTTPWGVWKTVEILEGFFQHKGKYSFEVRCNPTVTKAVYNKDGTRKKQGCKKPLAKKEVQEWFEARQSGWGFKMETGDFQFEGKQRCFKRREQRHITNDAYVVKGILEIEDVPQFMKTVQKGIGDAKAFGFGLFLLNPIN